ncbi:MAG: replication initiator protein A [Saccharofermentans sp.]|nr:replication initiator protein A [Saccharofermentans sp.]
MKFNYLSLEKSTSYSYFVIPKQLVKDPKFKKISTDAKLLYSLLMDRASLSIRNGWIDDNNHVYIYYTNNEIIEDLGCSKNTVTKLMQELVSIGLVEKIKQGLNRPDKIYVKDFTDEIETESSENSIKSTVLPESQNLGVRNPKIWDSGIPLFVNQESQNLGANKTDINNTKKNKTNSSGSSTKLKVSDISEESCFSETAATADIISSVFDEKDISLSGKYFVNKWKSMNCSLDLIRLAIQDNLFRKDKLQLKHVDATLTEWFESGITSTDEATVYMQKQHEANKCAYRKEQSSTKRNVLKTGAEAGIKADSYIKPEETLIMNDAENEYSDAIFDLFSEVGINSV